MTLIDKVVVMNAIWAVVVCFIGSRLFATIRHFNNGTNRIRAEARK